MKALATALYNRSQVAGSFKTSIGDRFYLSKAKIPLVYPHVVYHILNANPEYYMGSQSISGHNFEEIMVSMNIHSKPTTESSSEAGDILGYLKTQFDDCDLTITGWNDIKMERVNVLGPFWDDGTLEWIYSVEYNVTLQKS